MGDARVVIADQNVDLIIDNNEIVVELGTSGPQGIQGPPGDPGNLGYVYYQPVPSAEWTIYHGLSFIPSITVVDSAGTVVEGNYEYPDEDTVIASFSGAFSGKAYLS